MVYRRTKKLANGKVKHYKYWWYKFTREGALYQVNTKQGNKRTAEDLEGEHRTRLARGDAGLYDPAAIPTLKVFEPRFTAAIETRCAGKNRTIEFYKEKMANLLAFGPLAQAKLNRIDEALIEKFVQHRLKQIVRAADETHAERRITPATVNRALATLRRALRLAYEWKIIGRVPRIRLLPGERCREFVLSREKEPEYLAACPQPLQDLATLLLDTGMRVGEALALEWSDVILVPGNGAKFGYIQVRSGKSRNARRVILLTERAKETLQTRIKEKVDAFVFSSSRGKPYLDTYLARLQQRVREKLKWSDEFVIHSLRHTMLTRLGEAGVDLFTLKRVAGHSSVTVSEKYIHPSPEALERAFERLEAYNAGETKKSAGVEKSGYTEDTPSRKQASSTGQVVENAA